jgi:hypothetical protein
MIYLQRKTQKLQVSSKQKINSEVQRNKQLSSVLSRSGGKNERAEAGIVLMIHRSLPSTINSYTFWNERIIEVSLEILEDVEKLVMSKC